MTSNRLSLVATCAASLASFAALAPASAVAAPQQIAYVDHFSATTAAYLVDYQAAHRAHVVSLAGMGDGSFADNASGQRVVTLDAPIAYTQSTFDCNGLPMTQTVALDQLSFQLTSGTTRRGSAQVIELGRVIDVDGCTPGLVTPYGALTDAGLTTDQLLMTARPAITDLVPGVQLAGFTETPLDTPTDVFSLSADVVTFGTGSLTFAATGHAIAASVSNQWIVLALPGGARAFTRLSVDAHNGQEVWMAGSWNGTAPTNVWRALMVKPAAGAGFGGVTKASHRWESGLFRGTNNPFYIDLYKDGTGLRRSLDLAAGTESDTSITWRFSGLNIVQDRPSGGGTRERTWVPLANAGTTHWVMENEVNLTTGLPIILPRVNYYLDEGVSPPPAATPRGR
jgi:hypothetical protein